MFFLRVSLAFIFFTAVFATYGGGYGGGGQYAEYDCGGNCGGGCGHGNPCGNSAPVVQYVSSGCSTGECGGGGGHSRSSRYSSGSSSGYHRSETTVTKEEQQSSLKIIVGKPAVHRTTYVQQPQPVVHRTTYIEPEPQPQVVYKKQRYVDQGDYSGGCDGPCGGGGSKIVKYIKKTTYGSGNGCDTCAAESYTGDVEYSQPTVVRKVTRIVTQPKVVTRVIKTVVNQEAPSGEYYESGSSYGGQQPQGCGGDGCGGGGGGYYKKKYRGGGGGGGGASAKAGAFAYASASASAGAGGAGQSGDYVGGGGGGCKSGCDEWKK